MKTKIVLPLVIAAAAAIVTKSVNAQPAPHQIVLTEDSSTSLTATYDGSPVSVTFNGPDNWSVTFPSYVSFPPMASSQAWGEPENTFSPLIVNAATPAIAGGQELSVQSEIIPIKPFFLPDETTSPFAGTDSRDGGSLSITFDDDAATAEATVPDTGSTFALLFLSLLALLGAKGLRSLQLA